MCAGGAVAAGAGGVDLHCGADDWEAAGENLTGEGNACEGADWGEDSGAGKGGCLGGGGVVVGDDERGGEGVR